MDCELSDQSLTGYPSVFPSGLMRLMGEYWGFYIVSAAYPLSILYGFSPFVQHWRRLNYSDYNCTSVVNLHQCQPANRKQKKGKERSEEGEENEQDKLISFLSLIICCSFDLCCHFFSACRRFLFVLLHPVSLFVNKLMSSLDLLICTQICVDFH